MTYPLSKLKFRPPKTYECLGKAEAKTCLDCIKANPAMIACSRLGDFLDKATWNRCIGSGPLYQRDYKVREAGILPDYHPDYGQVVDKYGHILKIRKVA